MVQTSLSETKPEVQTPYIRIWMEENILHCAFADNLNLDLDIAKHCVAQRISFSQGIQQLCLIDMRTIRSTTKEAREYMAKEGAQLVKAGALLIGSALTRTIGNIFLTINKPPVPSKLFTNEKDAKEWLMQYL